MSEYHTSYYKFDSPADEDVQDDEVTYLMHVPDKNKAMWHHIEDLDGFFKRVYRYHQNHGFLYSCLQKLLQIVKYTFLAIFITLLTRCINFDILFANTLPPGFNATSKLHFEDVLYSGHDCSARITGNALVMILLVLASIVLFIKTVKFIFDCFHLSEIRRFYSAALHIKPVELDDLSWQEVQQRLMMVQKDQQMCIHKQRLTELDIYNRVLRFDNYFIAMVNKGLLPPRFNVPFLGEVVFFTNGLKLNMEWMFFWGLRRFFFANSFHMKDECKLKSKRIQLANQLSAELLLLGMVNLLFMPLIFCWQTLYTFFRYADMLKREPGAFTARKWSIYGQFYLRHFNELPHEFRARLNRGYRPATAYMDTFGAPILSLLAKEIGFMAGAIVAVFLVLALWDTDVLDVQHILVIGATLSFFVHCCYKLVPDQHAVRCPEQMMRKVLAQVHYSPDSWRAHAHTYQVRNQFAQIFQYKAAYIIEEILSPVITPFVLIFWVRRRSLQFVDFFRNFTVDIAGVGDVCSFAQLDINKHGDPKWHQTKATEPNFSQQADDGKVELSLMHFAVTNPKWAAPEDGDNFLTSLKVHAQKDAAAMTTFQTAQNPLLTSLHSVEGGIALMNPGIQQFTNSMVLSSIQPTPSYQENQPSSDPNTKSASEAQQHLDAVKIRGSRICEGPVDGSFRDGVLTSLLIPQGSLMEGHPTSLHSETPSALYRDNFNDDRMRELASLEMSISALYMHELHHQRLHYDPARTMWETIPSNADDDESSYHGDDNQSSVLVRPPPPPSQPSASGHTNYNATGLTGEDLFGHLSDGSVSHDQKSSAVSGSHGASQPQPFLTINLDQHDVHGDGGNKAISNCPEGTPATIYLHEDDAYHDDSTAYNVMLPQSNAPNQPPKM